MYCFDDDGIRIAYNKLHHMTFYNVRLFLISKGHTAFKMQIRDDSGLLYNKHRICIEY